MYHVLSFMSAKTRWWYTPINEYLLKTKGAELGLTGLVLLSPGA